MQSEFGSLNKMTAKKEYFIEQGSNKLEKVVGRKLGPAVRKLFFFMPVTQSSMKFPLQINMKMQTCFYFIAGKSSY